MMNLVFTNDEFRQEMIATGQCATVERFTAADEPEKDRAKKVRSLKEALKVIDRLVVHQKSGVVLTPSQVAICIQIDGILY